ncbi:FUSC family protein [Methylocella tundrae]|uniref:FUSC family protein n=1 Tax=Methylocella tundrae TaxID=227605 RepID=A0A4U8Z2X0_METTU|nr:FUSC family protein [Methylocella tundrae]WPP03576.1 FUSC family protein [Methylocella tundrae]VFU09688.1 FUSC family protein [Methylocella tundrae]
MNAIITSFSNSLSKPWRWLTAAMLSRRVELRLAVRVTVATLLTYALSLLLHVPQVLWTVLTAVVMSQLSLGKSLKTTVDYFIGTLGGAVYSGLIAAFTPHDAELEFMTVLAVSIGPLAFLAAVKPQFSAAPFTAVMVLLAPTITHVPPLESAFFRVIEVALGGAVALFVSFFVLPSRAHHLGIEAAANMLQLMAGALRRLLAGCAAPLDVATVGKIQGDIGPAMSRLEIIADEARRERVAYFSSEPDLKPLLRLLLRVRHDLVIIGRAAVAPLPDGFRARLAPSIARIAESAARFLEESGDALVRRPAPSLVEFEAALNAYEAEIAALRQEGLTRSLPIEALERLFGLAFALEQLHQDLKELARWSADFAQAQARR